MWECKKCGETVEDNFEICWNCGVGRDGKIPVPPSVEEEKQEEAPVPPPPNSAPKPVRSRSPQHRYKDAYRVARGTVGFGRLVKITGIVLGIFIILLSLALTELLGQLSPLAGCLIGCAVGIPLYSLGILISAQGQTLLASLDTAVNTSPLLTLEQKTEVMNVSA